jgi:hypothetical protein
MTPMNLLVIDAQAARIGFALFSWEANLPCQVSGELSEDEEELFLLRDGAGRVVTELPRLAGLEDSAYLAAVKQWLDEHCLSVEFVAHAMNTNLVGDADERSMRVAHAVCEMYAGVPQVGVVPARAPLAPPEGVDALRRLARKALDKVAMPLAA